MGRRQEEIAAALELYDRYRTPKNELLGKIMSLRDNTLSLKTTERLINEVMVGVAEMILERDGLKREREDLRMFCAGMARNISEMLK